jgi:hypothetical protein
LVAKKSIIKRRGDLNSYGPPDYYPFDLAIESRPPRGGRHGLLVAVFERGRFVTVSGSQGLRWNATLDRQSSARHGWLGYAQEGPQRLEGMSGRIVCLALGLMLSAISASQLSAASLLEKNFWLSGPRYERDMPACDYPAALDRIIGDFHTKEARFWNSELQIVGIENIRQTAVLPWAAQSIPRRFCSGTAVISDGAKHPIYYSIAEDAGLVGADWGVEFCVTGLDRNWAYEPSCRAARP